MWYRLHPEPLEHSGQRGAVERVPLPRAAALRTDRSLAAAGRSLTAACRAVERAGDGLDRMLRDFRREIPRRQLEITPPSGPDRDHGPSR